MNYTAIPSVKGQITIPSDIREKYGICKDTPVVITDTGKGVITIKVMRMVDSDTIEFFENEKEIGLNFKNGIDPQALINAIEELDG
ncbi:AbrB/MazE/SpoVT family DNA-binding domain-containing protein [Patescibacteria group bacterium]|nr:AbrB/MazE/SpoVT family DNA-binding domain-containing protein [Patescibacteria group bacterium]